MLQRLFEKIWVQNVALAVLIGLAIHYFGFVFEFKYNFDWSILFKESHYGHMGLMLLDGLGLTITITLYSAAIALGLGTLFGLARLSTFKPVNAFATAYVEFFRNTPLLVQLFFWNFALPNAIPEEIRFKLFELHYEFWAATVGLGIFTSAFMAEIIRAGIQSVPKGLLEAAYSSGLTFSQTLRKIILPLAFREIIPPLGSEFLNNMKNSSLAMTLGVTEVCWTMQEIESLTYHGFEATVAATIIYLSLSLIIAAILNLVNVKLKIIPLGKTPTMRRVADAVFAPLEFAWERTGRAIRRARRRSKASLTLTPLARFVQQAKKQIVLGSKVAFVLMLAWLVFKTIQGVASFDFKVIADNLRALLIWRFPNGGNTEVFLGLGGLSMSILMAVIAITCSFFIGLFVGMGRCSANRAVRVPCTLYIELIRGNPLIIVIFWMYFFIPVILKVDLNVFWSATWAMTIFFGAYIAEIVRAGIENIPPGQVEAAKSTGLGYFQTMRHIILPQALKQMLPAIVGMFIAAFKDTSLAYIIGVTELTTAAYSINNRLMLYPFEIYTTIAVMYFIFCYLMSRLATRLEKRLNPEVARIAM
ncbi:MAG: amino acid ABC transporter permease [Desulfovibrionaceae bacterium]|jgi:polar amino acid transport system permease protein|nr:amino acid ABC transporter permease [Desulfovibrionaceae bacterium]